MDTVSNPVLGQLSPMAPIYMHACPSPLIPLIPSLRLLKIQIMEPKTSQLLSVMWLSLKSLSPPTPSLSLPLLSSFGH